MRRFGKIKKIAAICLVAALLMGLMSSSLSSASKLTDDFILFDFTEKEIMKESSASEEGIFWTDPTGSGGWQTFRFIESEEDGSYYEFTNAGSIDDPFFCGSLKDRSFSSEYKYVKMLYKTVSKGATSLYFWGSDKTPLGGSTSESFTKICDGNWNTVITEITNKTWSGTINMFRLNTMKNTSAKGDTFDLKYIALFKTREEAESYEFVKGANFITDKSTYNIGETITVSYLNTVLGDWFGIFGRNEDPAVAEPVMKKSAEAGSSVKSLLFEGNTDLLLPGEYTICLMNGENQTLQQRNISMIQKADYSKLDALLVKVGVHSDYTEETIRPFEEALAKVEYDRPAEEQEKIDSQIAVVENAFYQLKLKSADYWDVNSAIDKVPGDLTVYTSASVKTLKQAENAVLWEKDITEQEIVDGYAKAIYDAIDGLIRKKDAVSSSKKYSAVNGALAGTDDLGRVLPMNDTVPDSREGKRFVGVFYFLWQGQHGTGGPYDNSKLEFIEGALASEKNWIAAGGGAVGEHHFWGEPLFGYYTSKDEWVMRKHVQMLADADVDFLVFDTTNGFTYTQQALTLMSILYEYQQDGWDVPQVAFYTNSASGTTMARIYNEIYCAHPEYEGLWFRWEEKPMIIGDASVASQEVKDFFRIKANQWPNESRKDDGFPWMEFSRSLTDLAIYGTNGEREVMNVSIAQHGSTTRFSATAWYGANDSSRSWHDGANDTSEGAVNMGYNFAEQWEFAISKDPEMIFITGWNEWVAQRQPGISKEPIVFVDCANENNSRDAEPMKGGFGDNYYMQMMSYIREYKGTDPRVDIGKNRTIQIRGSFNQWNSKAVTARYEDYAGDISDRDAVGFGNLQYTNTTGRNDIRNMMVARDTDTISFYADTAEDITAPSEHWMTLFLNTGNTGHDNWKGYDYVLNRVAPEKGKAILEKYDSATGGWIRVAAVDMKVQGNQMMISVPRKLLDLGSRQVNALNLQFKWADNYQEEQDIVTFYEDGDTAPYGRLNYVFSGADEKQQKTGRGTEGHFSVHKPCFRLKTQKYLSGCSPDIL